MSTTSLPTVWYPKDVEVMASAVVQAYKTPIATETGIDRIAMAKIVYRLYSMGLRDPERLAQVAALSAARKVSRTPTLAAQH
ncbi:hypothetical protein NT26_0986 [Pseudorhizobium banfieldiae]|uniref:Uncharacterized protein n=1 Tax=Pseudorhizobium banfieldiae TaxID=1125847 RepID=L0NCD9_9HYPH|nr:hypothetical protein [Pseudorhizobium banfieldiae]CAD6603434.1 hypothetical protein RNT25_01372 [arsenite-oxidising bacterium NT-25]CCF18710.1 hypothetical protein NT26_0986 [Pseudorhizobium banfieldiae]